VSAIGGAGAIAGGGAHQLHVELVQARKVLFWIFLGGFCWVMAICSAVRDEVYRHWARDSVVEYNQLWGLIWALWCLASWRM